MYSDKTPRYDTYVLQYALQPRFWILGVFLLGWWIATVALGVNTPPPPSDDKDSRTVRLSFTLHLAPYITTKLRKNALLLLNVSILSSQLLEGYWIAVTLMRGAGKLGQAWPDYAGRGFIASTAFLYSFALMAALCVAISLFVVMTIVFQLVIICELSSMVPGTWHWNTRLP